jgi:hypothetical protein
VIGGMVAIGYFISRNSPNQRNHAGECVLHDVATVVTRNTPIGRAMNWNTDVLAIRNMDGAEWINPEVTIYGFVTTGGSRTPTGPHTLGKGAVLRASDLIVLDLYDFEKPIG